MVIRRIREHAATYNWFAVAIDIVVVVIGVFLGTQANNWNQARIERAAAADYRREIIDDLKDNEADLASRKAYYEAVRGHAVAALAALEALSAARGEPFLVDAYQASQVWLRPLVRTGYDEMTGAGLTHGLGDRETRSRLTNYYTQIHQFDITALNMTAYRERVRRALPYAVQLAIRTQCGEQVITLLSGGQSATLPDRCAPGLDQPTIDTAVARLRAADLDLDLTRHIADLDQKLAGFERFGQQARKNRLLLEAQDR